MPFRDFIGNEHIVAALRRMLGASRVPHALLFSGPRGVGKYTLARMFAQAANCQRLTDDFCGQCDACRRTAALANPQPLIDRGLEERGASPDAATVERVPLVVQGHPDVWLVVPDPVRLRNPVVRPVIRMGQLRAVQRAATFRPAARRRVFILDGADTMRWDYADIFLKVLEEPPESATLVLLAANAEGLSDTIRSRCMQFFFAPLRQEQVEAFLEDRGERKPGERKLAAQLSGGCPGVALTLDLEESARLRKQLLELLHAAYSGRYLREVFAQTEQLAKDKGVAFENLLEVLYSLFNDLLELSHGLGERAVRNPDLLHDLQGFSAKIDFEWVVRAVRQLNGLHSRLRRNINRQLALDALAATLGETQEAGGEARRTRA
jgi:DNA polymerase-3 subunit delta'